MGDSKTDFFGYQPTLLSNLDALGNWDRIDWAPELASPGWTSQSLFQQAPAWTAGGLTPDFILVNIGINDAGITSQANYELWLGGALDTAHAKWPSAKLLVMRVWGQGHDAQCNAIDDVWIPDVLATRSPWATAGPDERVVLKDGDNGASRTIPPGIHPNTFGYALTAAAWQASMGY